MAFIARARALSRVYVHCSFGDRIWPDVRPPIGLTNIISLWSVFVFYYILT